MSTDSNADAAGSAPKATDKGNELPAALEAAWEAWIKGIQGIDERAWTLLRAAFEAGAEAAGESFAAALGRRGGLKGGKARAHKLTPQERQDSARNAARARWDQESS